LYELRAGQGNWGLGKGIAGNLRNSGQGNGTRPNTIIWNAGGTKHAEVLSKNTQKHKNACAVGEVATAVKREGFSEEIEAARRFGNFKPLLKMGNSKENNVRHWVDRFSGNQKLVMGQGAIV